ncbi:NAD(P)H-dependent oxidoreductase [Dactylosporangium sucinum]|uniref:NADPH-dependent FMN reductase-like domain-containing protein n=1 Tax=Dactylosporangium sucinum TaxID=1424081 RepID=A0A917U9T9_9ACTN|nr:NAD(P)H-dependent oxidoreductase [Dactylosporangium sucinum]GGM63129.1 hypothetical protein GCM10007977_075900 [Dactylosporangium sucinum]
MARILLVYSSLFGANAQLAALAEAALGAAGADVRVRRVREVALTGEEQAAAEGAQIATGADLTWAEGFVFCSPSHTGLLSASMKAFIDQHHDSAAAGAHLNKTFTAMATSGYAHAGQERVVDELNAVGAAWGCVIVAPGTADEGLNVHNGNPYGLSFVLEHGRLPGSAETTGVLRRHLHRLVAVTDALAPLRAADARTGTRTVPTIAGALT